MDSLKNHLLFNLIVVIGYQSALFLLWTPGQGGESELAFLIFSAFCIALHVLVSVLYIVYCFVKEKKDKAKEQAIALALVLLFGGTSCVGLVNAF